MKESRSGSPRGKSSRKAATEHARMDEELRSAPPARDAMADRPETRLSASDNLYRTLVENLPQRVFCKDRDGRYLSMNSAFARDLKIKPDDCVGKTDHDFFPKELADKYRADDQRILDSGKVEKIEETYVCDGEPRIVHTTKFPARDERGAVIGVMGLFWDVTDQKKAEETQRRQKQELVAKNRIAQVFLNVPDEQMYAEVLKVILEVTDSKYGVFGYIDEDGALMIPSMTRGIWWEQCNVPEKDIRFPCDKWGDGSWPRALREKKTNYTNEVSVRVPKGHIPISRHISLPIVYRGESIGLLQVANRETDYNENDIALLEELGNQIAPSLMARLQRDREGKRRKRVENELKETVEILAAASSAIVAATSQVASGTAETAAAISQTSTTVEEVRQAARLSSDKARNVSDSAQRIAQVSQSGQRAVQETAAGMLHIRDQMESIAQTIIRLSEQSQSIGGIIASVTDLADQSNLLAVNAAIEAARAGEQGKAFAVVAQEIKSLAEQSKQATTQVRGILNDVQKATSAAVMATEQGSKAVEAGVKQSAQAGEAIRVLSEGSGETAQTATQIVASSQQQVVGMDQIGVAMESINQAGAQTAASMRQAEVAAQNLHELGQKLKRLVEQYRT